MAAHMLGDEPRDRGRLEQPARRETGGREALVEHRPEGTAQPARDGHAEALLAARNGRCRQEARGGALEDVLGRPPAQLQACRHAARQLHEPVVEQRRPDLEAGRHRRPIDGDQRLIPEIEARMLVDEALHRVPQPRLLDRTHEFLVGIERRERLPGGRSEQLRLSINGRYVYGDNANTLIARNARGTIKLDFFITKRLYWFVSSYFESDRFQDLKMRTALATGPGYQFIERGDFSGILKNMTLYAEAGLAYFNEDFRVADDASSFRGRWSLRLNWPILDDRITFYHFDELYPSLQNTKNYYLTMDNGVRFKLIEGFVSNFQVTTRFNSNPAKGTGDTDNLYLWTLGYSFDTTKKR